MEAAPQNATTIVPATGRNNEQAEPINGTDPVKWCHVTFSHIPHFHFLTFHIPHVFSQHLFFLCDSNRACTGPRLFLLLLLSGAAGSSRADKSPAVPSFLPSFPDFPPSAKDIFLIENHWSRGRCFVFVSQPHPDIANTLFDSLFDLGGNC
ncbi:hypothetical protein BV898_17902 [Hypsibius exemplaris]|uniref:Uncharacterized protein n=1 Tax=Hypsibius exemplaris TaxID=2072580 RepID=A0A9X6NHS9_HYPEX|nr:hypothetical protein BV898_17902 [Hypsibius exemplaris]